MSSILKTGKGGRNFQDRELAARVRSLTLERCEQQLKKGKGKLYEAVLLRLAGSVLPRLNEISGPNGSPVPIMEIFVPPTQMDVQQDNSDQEDTGTEKAD